MQAHLVLPHAQTTTSQNQKSQHHPFPPSSSTNSHTPSLDKDTSQPMAHQLTWVWQKRGGCGQFAKLRSFIYIRVNGQLSAPKTAPSPSPIPLAVMLGRHTYNDNRTTIILTTMKNLTLFLLTLTAFSSYGQDKTKETPTADFKRVQIGINVSPDVCFRTLKNNDGSWSSDLVVDQRNKMETVKVGYTAGLNVCFNIKKFVGLETGIQYSNKGYQTKKQDLIFGQPDPSLPKQSKFVYDFHCIDIPVKANFTIGKKKVRFFTSVGVTTNIFIKETQTSFVSS